jgi:hypothetical protein
MLAARRYTAFPLETKSTGTEQRDLISCATMNVEAVHPVEGGKVW